MLPIYLFDLGVHTVLLESPKIDLTDSAGIRERSRCP